ncbi:hypothetical protein [Nocardia sp. R7R-8]|uniref:hypothetical protein n=1 Tax=Nocardia sp. R7R-8 TaxID=3459304 RepID=UPI00403D9203
MPEYHLRWEIDVTAEDPVSAAFAAFDLFRAPDSTATMFDVTDPAGDSYRVDLDDEVITPHPISRPARPRPGAGCPTRALPATVRRRAAAWCAKVSTVFQQYE